jgi:hypothetical protein
MTPIKAGDEVRVFMANPNWKNAPADGWQAEVTKAGRKYATASWVRQSTASIASLGEYTVSAEFDMETGYEKGKSAASHGRCRMRTYEQIALDEREASASAFLRSLGIELSWQHRFTLEQIEALAEVAKTFTTPEAEG